MHLNRITLAAAILSMMSWVAIPTFAGGPNSFGHGHGFGSPHRHGHGSGISGGLTGDASHGSRAPDDPHSNKGGAQRGLDRANDVAGPHGEQGRGNAAEHQAASGPHDGDSDSDIE